MGYKVDFMIARALSPMGARIAYNVRMGTTTTPPKPMLRKTLPTTYGIYSKCSGRKVIDRSG